jgi:lysophospholipase L1-like esterase
MGIFGKKLKYGTIPLELVFIAVGISGAQTKLACIGNSITAAYGYPDSLQKLLGSKYKVENDGVSSMTMLRKGGSSYWTKGKLADVFAFKPDWITIKLGTNDSKPEIWSVYSGDFKKDYLAMIDTLSTISSKPKIWIVIPCPTWRIEANRPNDVNLIAIMAILKQIAAERNLPIIDARTPLLNFKPYFSPDYIHPNSAGSDTVAHVLYRALMKGTTDILRIKPDGNRVFFFPGTIGWPGGFDLKGVCRIKFE